MKGRPSTAEVRPDPRTRPKPKTAAAVEKLKGKLDQKARDRSDGEHQSDSQEATAGEQTTGKKSVKDAPQLRSILVLSPPFTKV